MGPIGLGILIIRKEKLKNLKYIFKGTDSVNNSSGYLPYKNELKNMF